MKNFILENFGYILITGIIAACTVALSIQLAFATKRMDAPIVGNSVSVATSVTVVP